MVYRLLEVFKNKINKIKTCGIYPITQSTVHPINESITHEPNQSINYSTTHFVIQLTSWMFHQSNNHTSCQLTNQSINPFNSALVTTSATTWKLNMTLVSINQPICQPISQPKKTTNHSTNQSANQPISNQLIS